eukprot:GEMP01009124.1.p1 GENE.GEMP01009124.1~~GEMP01009124.1.p1  ORF type:complete len:679 (+),score=128.12 GEMP01009124.1:836-2872(+)
MHDLHSAITTRKYPRDLRVRLAGHHANAPSSSSARALLPDFSATPTPTRAGGRARAPAHMNASSGPRSPWNANAVSDGAGIGRTLEDYFCQIGERPLAEPAERSSQEHDAELVGRSLEEYVRERKSKLVTKPSLWQLLTQKLDNLAVASESGASASNDVPAVLKPSMPQLINDFVDAVTSERASSAQKATNQQAATDKSDNWFAQDLRELHTRIAKCSDKPKKRSSVDVMKLVEELRKQNEELQKDRRNQQSIIQALLKRQTREEQPSRLTKERDRTSKGRTRSEELHSTTGSRRKTSASSSTLSTPRDATVTPLLSNAGVALSSPITNPAVITSTTAGSATVKAAKATKTTGIATLRLPHTRESAISTASSGAGKLQLPTTEIACSLSSPRLPQATALTIVSSAPQCTPILPADGLPSVHSTLPLSPRGQPLALPGVMRTRAPDSLITRTPSALFSISTPKAASRAIAPGAPNSRMRRPPHALPRIRSSDPATTIAIRHGRDAVAPRTAFYDCAATPRAGPTLVCTMPLNQATIYSPHSLGQSLPRSQSNASLSYSVPTHPKSYTVSSTHASNLSVAYIGNRAPVTPRAQSAVTRPLTTPVSSTHASNLSVAYIGNRAPVTPRAQSAVTRPLLTPVRENRLQTPCIGVAVPLSPRSLPGCFSFPPSPSPSPLWRAQN